MSKSHRQSPDKEKRLPKAPSDRFGSPQALLEDEKLTTAEKREILLQWKYDLVERQVATEENMAGGDRMTVELEAVLGALRSIGEEGAEKDGPPTKHGT